MVDLTEPTCCQVPYRRGPDNNAGLAHRPVASERMTAPVDGSVAPVVLPVSGHERRWPRVTAIALAVGSRQATEIAWRWRRRYTAACHPDSWSPGRHGVVAGHWGTTGATLWAVYDALHDAATWRQTTPSCARHRPVLWLADRPAATILGADDDDVWRRRLAMVVEELAAEETGWEVPSWDQWYGLALRCRALCLAGGDRVLVAPAAAIDHATGPLHELASFPTGEVASPPGPRPEALAQSLVRARGQLQAAHATVRQVGAGLSPLADMCEAGSTAELLSDAHFAIEHAAETIERASRYLQASVCALGEDQTAALSSTPSR